MILKSLLTLSLIISLGQSASLVAQKTYVDGNIDFYLTYSEGEEQSFNDWVAVYKAGSSTEWKNVLSWSWVRDLQGLSPNDGEGHLFKRFGLPVGDYEARLFKNNSFTIDESLPFSIKKVNSFLNEVSANYNNPEQGDLRVFIEGITPKFQSNDRDWIALYKVGSSNEWQNVIAWSWVKKLENQDQYRTYWQLTNLNLPKGEYEIRYFLNNSYTTYKKSRPIVVQAPIKS